MVTARHIAEELGIAISTVGRAMNDDPRVSLETRAKVQRVAGRLGYVGNDAARMMRGVSSKLIGLVIPDVDNDFYSAIAQFISDCMDQKGYRVVLALTRDDREVEARQIRELVRSRAAGIIFVPSPHLKRESLSLLRGIPHVQLLRQVAESPGAWFGIDDQNALADATGLLIDQGHRSIGYIGGRANLSTGAARATGYRTALERAGLPVDPALERLGKPNRAFGEQALDAFLDRANPPTAVVTASVHITLGVIAAIERRGLAVPLDLSVVGFGGAPWFEWWRGGLTAVCPPVEELSVSCSLWLLNTIEKGVSALVRNEIVAKSRLIIRQTVASPPPVLVLAQ